MKDAHAILVVDDDPQSLALLVQDLSAEGYLVRPAASGLLALASIPVRPPDLILLTIRMPDIDGFEVCRRIKALEQTRDIPIIFLSSAREVNERVEGLELGAVDFIVKPFSRGELLARVRTHLELADLRADLERQVAERTAELRHANERLESELSERRRAEQSARESEHRFRLLANGAPVGIWVSGPDGRLLFHNNRALHFLGRTLEQPAEDVLHSVVHPDDLGGVTRRYSDAVQSGRPFRIECRVRRANGSYRWVLHTGLPRLVNGAYAGHIGTSIDITDIKRSHERIMAAQKLESLGVLAAGMAHDFNNLLATIFAASDLAMAELQRDSPARDYIARIEAAAGRASEIVNLLLAYAGGHCNDLEKIDLSSTVREILDFVKTSLCEKAELSSDLAHGLPVIQGNPIQLRQVILNLVMNAIESLGQEGGKVSVSTSMVAVGWFGTIQPSSDLPAGMYCRVVVSDNGCGIEPEVRAKIFDPFYTTKFIGRGLGLAAVQGIVRSAGGAIRVSSAPGVGSSFEVLLPCAGQVQSDLAPEPVTAPTVPAKAPVRAGAATQQTGTLLGALRAGRDFARKLPRWFVSAAS